MTRVIITFCLISTLFSLGFGSYFAYMNYTGLRYRHEMESAVGSYYTYYNAKDFKKIYDCLAGASFQDATTYKGFRQIMRRTYDYLGKYLSREEIEWRIHEDFRGKFFIIAYETQYQKGSLQDVFNLVKEENGWKLLGLPPH